MFEGQELSKYEGALVKVMNLSKLVEIQQKRLIASNDLAGLQRDKIKQGRAEIERLEGVIKDMKRENADWSKEVKSEVMYKGLVVRVNTSKSSEKSTRKSYRDLFDKYTALERKCLKLMKEITKKGQG